MKLPAFDHARQEWDKYKRFHVVHGNFVQFDTNEMICTIYSWQPPVDVRRNYSTFNFTVAGTRDSHLPTLKTPDGEIVPKTWVSRNTMQTLLIDHDTKRAVRLAGFGNQHRDKDKSWQAPIPVSLRGTCSAYFAGPGEPPVGRTVTVSRPAKYTKDEIEHGRTLVAACKMWRELEQPKPAFLQKCSLKELLAMDFTSMTACHRYSVAIHGITPTYDTTEYPYLLADI
jgi:hypothetical protein